MFTILLFNCKKEEKSKLKKPNILFILVDDLGYHDLGSTGSTFYETPNVDRLANQGMMFTQGYASSRVCSPSRASIMTGQFTARHGITDWIGAKVGEDWRTRKRYDKLLPADYVKELPKQDKVLAEAFKEEGYNTFFAGKWHLGDKGSYPEDHGFEINKGGFHRGGPSGGFFSPFKNPKLKDKEKGENLTIRLAKETAQFIQQQKDSTFFVFLSFYAVHAPIQTTETKWSKYRNKADSLGIDKSGYKMERVLPVRQVQDNPIYGGLVETMDDAVGIVLNALKENDLDKNTIVVFTSDNGGVASGDHYATSNLPLRGGKGYQWEGGIREPFFIKVPWLKNKATATSFPVIHTDFYPTLLDLANIPLQPEQHIDGISLKPILEGKEMNVDRPLYWHYPHYGNQGGEPSSIIQQNGWKLIHYWEDNREELFKLPSTEKDELNVITKHPKIAQKLSNQLRSWLKEVDAKYPEKDMEFDSIKRQKRRINIKTKKLESLEKSRLEVLSKDFKPNDNWWKSKITKD
ncbi:sulfatase [Polaribacter septentrionalilitoris]|uniref:sulfatase n=1 Tax=Polaribacter septentrionalilitoris TaxID=2494657 RepID=UPI00135C0039|nr:sulfatase [Polaribacter septentrionalilitoris]